MEERMGDEKDISLVEQYIEKYCKMLGGKSSPSGNDFKEFVTAVQFINDTYENSIRYGHIKPCNRSNTERK
jgi:hypothetical protein